MSELERGNGMSGKEEIFWCIEKNALYLGISCGQFCYGTLNNALKFHDLLSARELSNTLRLMFQTITSEFDNVKIEQHIYCDSNDKVR